MTPDTSSNLKAPLGSLGVFAIFSGIFLLLVVRNYGMYPTVMLDEYVHSTYARYISFADMEIPGYLYSTIYHLTAFWGDYYLEAARFMNVLFFVIGGYFTFRTANLYIERNTSLLIGALSLLLPFHYFTSLFMPDAMFYGLFWVFNYYVLSEPDGGGSAFHTQILGMLLGFLALVKPHALFLLPIYAIYFVFCKGWTAKWMRDVALFVIMALSLKLFVGYLLAGANGLTLFGGSYTEHATSALGESVVIIDAASSIILNAIGNLVLILLYFSVPIACIIRDLSLGTLNEQQKNHVFLTSLLILFMVGIVSVFSTTATIFDDNVDQRLYLRYYSYAFPMLLIASGYSLKRRSEEINITATYAALTMVIVVLIPAYYHTRNPFFYPFKAFITDSPEFYLLAHFPAILYGMSIFIAIGLIYWVMRPYKGTRLYLYVTIPLLIVATWVANHDNLSSNYQPDPFDLAGEYIRDHVDPDNEKDVTLVAYHEHKAKKVMMHLRTNDAKLLIVSPFDNQNIISWPDSAKMVVSLDSIQFTDAVRLVWSKDRVRVYHKSEN